MKTRTLLLLAVSCGLIILIAGSVKLFLVADATPPERLAIGSSATIGDMKVTVLSFAQADGAAHVEVSLIGVDDSDGARTWVLGTGEAQLIPIRDEPTSGRACAGTQKAQPTKCTLVFDTTATSGVLRYERAGEVRRWDLVEPSK